MIHVITLNANGLNLDRAKRRQIYQWFCNQNAHVLFIQETHYTNEIIKNHDISDWPEGVSYHSCGASNSRGVSILFKSSVNVNVINTHTDDKGRMLLLNTVIDDHKVTFMNIYAPNNDKERYLFYNKVFKKIDQHVQDDHALILGGDFNTCLNQAEDKEGGIKCVKKDAKYLNEQMRKRNLLDIWRTFNPAKRQYTYRQNTPLVRTRIDFFLVSNVLVDIVNLCDIRPSVRSDHQAVSLKLQFNTDKRGPGVWKLNTSVLHDVAYIKGIHDIINDVNANAESIDDDHLLWEYCKVQIKEFSIRYCVTKHQQKQQVENNLVTYLKGLNAIQYPDASIINEIERVNGILNMMYENAVKGQMVRSRVRWYEEGEKSSAYFLGLEKYHATKKSITKLKLSDDTVVTKQSDILKEEESFYSSLYTSANVESDDIKKYLDTVTFPVTLTIDEQGKCEGLLTHSECKDAVDQLKMSKSPGCDGLPAEFYKVFWSCIHTLVINSLNHSFTKGHMSTTQKRAIISLIYKKGDKMHLKNWRPISLLNTDYKILSVILANRLKKVISKVISTDQTGYIKGRFIGTNVRLIDDIINLCINEHQSAAVLFVDFEKAFDMVEWSFVVQTLMKFNFGSTFINWITVMYSDIESSVLNLGWKTKFFRLSRGLRQGCPLSALLFILVTEVLALNIRQDDSITGIILHENGDTKCEMRISQYADDTTLFCSTKDSLDNTLNVINIFGKYAGPKLNVEKTQGLAFGNFAKHESVKWPTDNIKALGVYFGHDMVACYKSIWQEKKDRLIRILNSWSRRRLTLYGKATIIKSLGLANLTYLMSCLPIPDNLEKEVDTILFKFLWNRKPEKIKRKTLIRSDNMGGIRMCDFKSQCIALKCMWLKRYMHDENGKWKYLFKHYLNIHGSNFLILNMNFVDAKNAPSLSYLPRFYQDLIKAWHSLDNDHAHIRINDQLKVKNQIIWGNDLILHNRKTLYYKHWIDSNIIYINDLLDNDGSFSASFICNKLLSKSNWIAELFIIMKSIPKKWFDLVKNSIPISVKSQMRTSCIYVNSKRVNIMYWKSKYIYVHLIEKKSILPIIQKRWNQEMSRLPKWQDIWTMKTIYEKEKKLAEFNYKLLFRIIAIKTNLYKWKIEDSPNCFVCKNCDDFQHAFIDCPMSANFWERFKVFVISTNIPCPDITLKVIILGNKPGNQNTLNVILNRMISLATYTLYRSRLLRITKNKQIDTFKWFLNELSWRSMILKQKESMWGWITKCLNTN